MTKVTIPKDIHDLVCTEPALVLGESKEQYVALYTGMVSSLKPMDHADYLWLWRYTDATWELIRARRIRAGYLNELMRRAYDSDETVNPWEVLATEFGESQTKKLEYLDRVIASSQRDCDTILQLMEARHDLFAHRARERKLHELEIEGLERTVIAAAPALAPAGEHEPAE